MKHALSILIVLSFCANATSQESTFKVLTYNIWNGYDWGKDEERRSRVNEWIKNQEPSIVALQELCKYTSEKLAKDAASWGHEHSKLLKTTGYSVGLTSKHPIEVKEKIMKNMHHGALHCQTNGIDVFVIHFSPHSYLKRRVEAALILDRLNEVRKKNDMYIVLGDFNCFSPIDADLYDLNGVVLKRLRESNKDKPLNGNLFNGNIDYAVMSSLLAFPLIDVCQPFTQGMSERGSAPGQILRTVNNETEQELISRLVRIDYIMVSPELADKCIDAKVCNGEENYYLSDHYPVIAEFDYQKE
jgi:endonuclease/exonuclease/phosphatase family metal-dependent hydrolase